MTQSSLGHRIRSQRLHLKIAQGALARMVDVSPAYINLIEHDKRPVGGKLLNQIASALEMDARDLSGERDAWLLQALHDIPRGLVPGAHLTEDGAAQLVARAPDWAETLLRLHRLYQEASETAAALSDRLNSDPELMEISHRMLSQVTSIRSFSDILRQIPDLTDMERRRFLEVISEQSAHLSDEVRAMMVMLEGDSRPAVSLPPGEEVEEFLSHRRNYFPEIEDAAIALRAALELPDEAVGAALDAALEARLRGVHGAHAAPWDAGADSALNDGADLRYDPHDRLWSLRPGLRAASARFRKAQLLCRLELSETFAKLALDPNLSSPDARASAQKALARYGAGAVLFPYDAFLAKAQAARYDVEQLSAAFEAGFEQICHRLATLRRPEASAPPFALLRVDPAGNISKRFSIPGLRMPRSGGGCPLWAAYVAFGAPGRVTAQMAETQDGARYVFIARRVARRPEKFGAPTPAHSVMIACDAAFADQIVYADMFTAGSDALATPVGVSCRACGRLACAQRAHPPAFTPKNSGGGL